MPDMFDDFVNTSREIINAAIEYRAANVWNELADANIRKVNSMIAVLQTAVTQAMNVPRPFPPGGPS